MQYQEHGSIRRRASTFKMEEQEYEEKKRIARLPVTENQLRVHETYLYMIKIEGKLVKAVVRTIQVASDHNSAEVQLIEWKSPYKSLRLQIGSQFTCLRQTLHHLHENEK